MRRETSEGRAEGIEGRRGRRGRGKRRKGGEGRGERDELFCLCFVSVNVTLCPKLNIPKRQCHIRLSINNVSTVSSSIVVFVTFPLREVIHTKTIRQSNGAVLFVYTVLDWF